MRHWIQTLVLFLLLPAFVVAQEPEVKRERTFEGAGLYGFMNGGADQFLEYGVSQLVTRDLIYKGEAYTIDLYEMPTPEDAFGIYSLHVFKCARADSGKCIDCLSPYQLQAVAGNRYISVVFPSGSSAAKSNADELIRLYAPMDGEGNPKIPDELGLSFPYSGRLKLLRGPISVSGASTSLSALLNGISYSGVWFVPDKPTKGYKALIYVADGREVEKLKAKVSSSDIIRTGSNFLYLTGKEKAKKEDDHGDFGF